MLPTYNFFIDAFYIGTYVAQNQSNQHELDNQHEIIVQMLYQRTRISRFHSDEL